jgi:hypothetical protein
MNFLVWYEFREAKGKLNCVSLSALSSSCMLWVDLYMSVPGCIIREREEGFNRV